MAPPAAAGGIVGAQQQVDLVRLRHCARGRPHQLMLRCSPREGDLADTAATFPSHGRCRRRCRQQALFRQVGGVGESRRLADDDPDAGSPVAPARQFFYLAVVEEDRRARAVLGEDLCEVTSPAQCLVQDPFQEGSFDEVGGRAVGEGHGVRQSFRPIMPPSTPPATPAPAARLDGSRRPGTETARGQGSGAACSGARPCPVP